MKWSQSEIDFVMNNYQKMSHDEIGKILNRTGASINLFCKRNKLKKGIRHSNKEKIEAFGEYKTVLDWTRDDRCLASYDVLRGRLRMNWNTELAIITPDKEEVKVSDKYEELTLVEITDIVENNLVIGVFDCSCGTKNIRRPITYVKRGRIKSCGCLINKNKITHGDSGSRLYQIWHHMKRRCYEKHNKDYQWYGLLGVIVCDQWKDNYSEFKQWALESGYNENLTIDRKESTGNYEPNNCMWIPINDQNDNKRKSIKLTAFGETKTIKKWLLDNRCKVKKDSIIRYRIKKGWDHEKAITY